MHKPLRPLTCLSLNKSHPNSKGFLLKPNSIIWGKRVPPSGSYHIKVTPNCHPNVSKHTTNCHPNVAKHTTNCHPNAAFIKVAIFKDGSHVI